MGHYDDCYEAQVEESAKRAKDLAKSQLKAMRDFRKKMFDLGWDGIPDRHVGNFQDMINDTYIRSQGKEVE